MKALCTVSYEHMHSIHGIMNTCKSTNEVVHKHTDTWLHNFTIRQHRSLFYGRFYKTLMYNDLPMRS